MKTTETILDVKYEFKIYQIEEIVRDIEKRLSIIAGKADDLPGGRSMKANIKIVTAKETRDEYDEDQIPQEQQSFGFNN